MLLLGALFGAIIAHYLTKDRDSNMRRVILEREADIRRREFRRLIIRWIYRIQRPPKGQPEDPYFVFEEAMTEISAEFEVCSIDLPEHLKIAERIKEANATTSGGLESMMRREGKSRRELTIVRLESILHKTKTQA